MDHLLAFRKTTGIPDIEAAPDDFHELAELAAHTCLATMATIKFRVGGTRVLKARVGLDSLPHSGCDLFSIAVMNSRSFLVVPDTWADPRVSAHPLVTGDAGVRFFAGAAILDELDCPVGVICVFDRQARPDGLTDFQERALVRFAKAAGAQISSAKAHALLKDSEGSYRLMTELMPQMVWGVRGDGHHDYFNSQWYEFTGATPGATEGNGWAELFHPEDRAEAWKRWRASLAAGRPYQGEYRLRHRSGEYRWMLGRALPLRDDKGKPLRWIGTCTDIHDQKVAEESARLTAERYRLAARATQDAIWDWNLLTDEVTWGQSAAFALGYDDDQLGDTGAWWKSKLHPADVDGISDSMAAVFERGEQWEQEYRFQANDGSYREIFDRGFVIRDSGGRPIRMVGAAMDVTERRNAERALQRSEERLHHALSAAKMIAWEREVETGAVQRSPNAPDLLGLSTSGRTEEVLERTHPDDVERLAQALGTGEPKEAEFRYKGPDGTYRWLLSRGRNSASGKVAGVTFDITERKEAEAHLERLATHDALTGLPNRVLFQTRFERALRRAREERASVSLLLVDLDDFKSVNDTLGHDAGDALLKEFARRLQELVGAPSTIARLGGDEFALLLTEPFTRAQAEAFAPFLVERLKDTFTHGGRTVCTRVSIGLAAYPEQGRSASELMKNADIALYEAKRRGRNRATIFSAKMRTAMESKVRLVEAIRRGIEAREFRPHYQPRVDLSTGEVVGFEALARWAHPERGLLGPAHFLVAFEDDELARELGVLITDQVAADAGEWVEAGVPFGRVAINLSTAEFRNPRLAHLLLSKWRAAGLAASMLDVEVTETVLLSSNVKRVTELLRRFRAAGATISLDDFGTGYASLTHLKQFPVDHLKIDRSFISGLEKRTDDYAITSAIIGLGRSLGVTVTAEGIETEAQADMLRELGCHHGQGFLFSKPVDGQSVPALARRDFSSFLTNKPRLRIV